MGGIMTTGMLRNALVMALALGAGGCETSVDFSDWAAGYDKAIEKTHNENMLLNMVRASYNAPMHFVTVAVARGSGTATGGASFTFPFGKGLEASRPFASSTVSLSVSGGFNFDMASLDNSEFVAGLLTPIAPATVHFYVNQGVPRELLFNLLIDKVTISDGGKTNTYSNDPTQPGYEDFRTTLKNLLDLGLTTESIPSFLPFGPPLTADEAKDPRILAAAAQAGVLIQPTGPNAYQIVKPMVLARFCFTGGGPSMPRLPSSALCGTSQQLGNSSTGKPEGAEQNFAAGAAMPGFQNAALGVTIRSTRDVFNYLGNVIYQQVDTSKPVRITMRSQEAKDYNYLKRGEDLLVVVKNNSSRDDLVRISYRGDTYSIPNENQGNSNLVFTVVSQILNLSKSVNLIPTTSAVVVR
jgi:hypothetical protein